MGYISPYGKVGLLGIVLFGVLGSGLFLMKARDGIATSLPSTAVVGVREREIGALYANKEELERTLRFIEPIRSASVIIDVSRLGRSSRHTLSRASVILDLDRSKTVPSTLLYTIQEHVSAAFSGLSPSQIAISDRQGNLLLASCENNEQRLIVLKAERMHPAAIAAEPPSTWVDSLWVVSALMLALSFGVGWLFFQRGEGAKQLHREIKKRNAIKEQLLLDASMREQTPPAPSQERKG